MDRLTTTGPDAPTFDIRTGYYLAFASRLAYEPLSEGAARLGLLGRIEPFTCGQFQGFVGRLARVALLAFRGTDGVENFLTDAKTTLVRHALYPGRVHEGFAEAVDQVWPDVRRLLGPPGRATPLWVTGHSLGGAMATLASARLAREGYAVRAVYTYGSPRSGDQTFREAYRVANFRVVNDNDLVAHLPFRWCYKHVGKLKLLDGEGNLAEEQRAWDEKKHALGRQAKRVQRAHARPKRPEPPLLEFDWLSDHRLDAYLEALRKAVSRVPRQRPVARPDGGSAGGPAQRTHRFDQASRDPPAPLATRRQREKPPLTEAQFAAAFFNQPQRAYGAERCA